MAERNASFWLANLPTDGVPWWDFRADLSQPLPWGAQKDSSAAAIAASGLWDLATQPIARAGRGYRRCALAMLERLAEPRLSRRQTPGWEGILRHGVYHTAKNLGVDESVMWGEFFFVEALSKARQRNAQRFADAHMPLFPALTIRRALRCRRPTLGLQTAQLEGGGQFFVIRIERIAARGQPAARRRRAIAERATHAAASRPLANTSVGNSG